MVYCQSNCVCCIVYAQVTKLINETYFSSLAPLCDKKKTSFTMFIPATEDTNSDCAIQFVPSGLCLAVIPLTPTNLPLQVLETVVLRGLMW